ncbi:MAG: VOC family protein [Allosphingosinicella sp.]
MAQGFIWYELMTTDQGAALDFYGRVVGWTHTRHPGGEPGGAPYMVLEADGRGVGGVFQIAGEEMKDAPPMWLGYVGVADADATADAIVAAGGSLRMGPADIPGVGRFALAADPGGAPFYILAPDPARPSPEPVPPRTPGHCGWHELYAGQGQEAAFGFYASLFGWETVGEIDMGAMGKYRLFGTQGEALGGMMDKPADLPQAGWGYYFCVEGIDAAAERVRAGGGTIRMGPMQVPDGSFVLQGSDPQGAVFALISKER